LSREISEGSHGDGGSCKSSLSEGGCPGVGSSFEHIGENKGNLFSVSIVDFLIYSKVEFN